MLVISAFQLVNSIIFRVEHSPGAKIASLLPHVFFIVVFGGRLEGKGHLTNSTLYHDYLVCIILSNRAMLLSYFKNLHNYRQTHVIFFVNWFMILDITGQ